MSLMTDRRQPSHNHDITQANTPNISQNSSSYPPAPFYTYQYSKLASLNLHFSSLQARDQAATSRRESDNLIRERVNVLQVQFKIAEISLKC